MKEETAKIIRFTGTGRRKTSVARVNLIAGTGEMKINFKPANECFDENYLRLIKRPLEVTVSTGKYDVNVSVIGGGTTGQAAAISLGIARALVKANKDNRSILSKEGLLTRDSRMVERKKYGRAGARRRFQFSKR